MEIAEYLLALQNETAPDPFTDINAYSYALNNGSHSLWPLLIEKVNELRLKPLKNYIDLTHQKFKVLRFQK